LALCVVTDAVNGTGEPGDLFAAAPTCQPR
jgi:hypothetical protein